MVVILASNRFLVRIPDWENRPRVFWTVQFINFLGACFMAGWGIPALEWPASLANYILALLFVFHVVQNNSRWTEARRPDLMNESLEERKERIIKARAANDAADEEPTEKVND